MLLARVANFFTTGEPTHTLIEEGRRDVVGTMESVASSAADTAKVIAEEIEDDEGRPPYLHVRNLDLGIERMSIDGHAGNVGWRSWRFDR
jgi:predicted alpha/beta-hydrolase family hydrolase